MRTLKTIIVASIFAIACYSGNFHASASILKGEIRDSISNESIPFVTIRIFSATDSISPLAVFATDVDGIFNEHFDKAGNMHVRFESMGKHPVIKSFTLNGNEDMDFGIIRMTDDEILLNEVEVVAMKPVVKAEVDRLSYNIKDDSDSRTYTLLEMLRKVPMVTVDGEDNISVNGSSSFQVYVNGKPNMMFSSNTSQIFKSMPASMVKSVEVITNPGARYDAEGAGGILNLVMDQSQGSADSNDYKATIGLHVTTRGLVGNLNFSGQKKKLTYYASATYNKVDVGSTDVSTSRISSERSVSTLSCATPRMNFSLGNFAADYLIDSLTTIGFTGSINHVGMSTNTSSSTEIFAPQAIPVLSYSSQGIVDSRRLSSTGSLSLSHGFTDNNKSNLSIIYQISHERNNNENEFDFHHDLASDADASLNLSDRNSHNLENTLENIIQADFSTHSHERHTFDSGVKVAFRRSRSSSLLELISDASEDSRYKNRSCIMAGYAEYSLPLSMINLKAGLRYEYTWQDISYDTEDYMDFSRRYGTLVPSASLSYNLSMSSNIGLTYNMRIARPGISYTNPYVDRSSPTSVSFGNPDLNIEKTHNIGVSYNMFSPKLMMVLRLSDSYTGDAIEQFSYISNGLLANTYGNVARRNIFRLDASGSWMASANTRVIINGAIGYATLANSRMHLSNEGVQWNVMAGLQHTLPWDIKGSAYLIASSRTYSIQGFRSGVRIVTLNLSKNFLNNRLSVSAGLTSGLFKGGKMKIENVSQTSLFASRSVTRVPMLSASVGVTYTFGSYTQKNTGRRKALESDYVDQRSDIESLSGASDSRSR